MWVRPGTLFASYIEFLLSFFFPLENNNLRPSVVSVKKQNTICSMNDPPLFFPEKNPSIPINLSNETGREEEPRSKTTINWIRTDYS